MKVDVTKEFKIINLEICIFKEELHYLSTLKKVLSQRVTRKLNLTDYRFQSKFLLDNNFSSLDSSHVNTFLDIIKNNIATDNNIVVGPIGASLCKQADVDISSLVCICSDSDFRGRLVKRSIEEGTFL